MSGFMLLRIFWLIVVVALSGCFVSDRDVEYREVSNYDVDIESEKNEYYIRKPNTVAADAEEERELELEPLNSLLQLPEDIISN